MSFTRHILNMTHFYSQSKLSESSNRLLLVQLKSRFYTVIFSRSSTLPKITDAEIVASSQSLTCRLWYPQRTKTEVRGIFYLLCYSPVCHVSTIDNSLRKPLKRTFKLLVENYQDFFTSKTPIDRRIRLQATRRLYMQLTSHFSGATSAQN